MSAPADQREDLVRARTTLEQLELRRDRAFKAWLKLEVGTLTEREARRRWGDMDERIEALRNRIRRLEHEMKGERWLRPA